MNQLYLWIWIFVTCLAGAMGILNFYNAIQDYKAYRKVGFQNGTRAAGVLTKGTLATESSRLLQTLCYVAAGLIALYFPTHNYLIIWLLVAGVTGLFQNSIAIWWMRQRMFEVLSDEHKTNWKTGDKDRRGS